MAALQGHGSALWAPRDARPGSVSQPPALLSDPPRPVCDSNGLLLFWANGFQATQGWEVAEDRTSAKAAGDTGLLSSLSGLSEAEPCPGQHRWHWGSRWINVQRNQGSAQDVAKMKEPFLWCEDAHDLSGGVRQSKWKIRTQMDLEVIILSEVSQTEKDKYHIISLICGI